jgi:hypothetical protein
MAAVYGTRMRSIKHSPGEKRFPEVPISIYFLGWVLGEVN